MTHSRHLLNDNCVHLFVQTYKLNNWRIKSQLDATYYFIMLTLCSTCFGHHYAHHVTAFGPDTHPSCLPLTPKKLQLENQTAYVVEHVRNVMAHAQKPDLDFQRNGRVHLNWRGGGLVQSTTGSRDVRISGSIGSNAGYTTFWGRVQDYWLPTHPSCLTLTPNQQQLENQTAYAVTNVIVVSSWWWA